MKQPASGCRYCVLPDISATNPVRLAKRCCCFSLSRVLLDCEVMASLMDIPSLVLNSFWRGRRLVATLRHEVAVMDVRVAITQALLKSDAYRIVEFTTWPLLSQFQAVHPLQRQRVIIRPDGFLHVADEQAEYKFFFLELDRSTEMQRVLAEKALCYRDFYASGNFALRSGASKEAFRTYPFRVLMVLQAIRRNNLCSTALKLRTALRMRSVSQPVSAPTQTAASVFSTL